MNESPFRPEHFERLDETADAEFYREPRLVVHIDTGAIAAAGRIYRSLLPAHACVLDLMSGWRSHLPVDLPLARVAGLGMNAAEMAANPQLSSYVVHDLNVDPCLPFGDDEFDGVINTVSVQYLTRPLEVFAEVYRVLRPNAPYVVTFSNRCFPTKAVRIWRSLGDDGHMQLVAAYFLQSAPWRDLHAVDCNPGAGGDPLYAVYGRKAPAGDETGAGAAEGR